MSNKVNTYLEAMKDSAAEREKRILMLQIG